MFLQADDLRMHGTREASKRGLGLDGSQKKKLRCRIAGLVDIETLRYLSQSKLRDKHGSMKTIYQLVPGQSWNVVVRSRANK
jgi:hypothetical protein